MNRCAVWGARCAVLLGTSPLAAQVYVVPRPAQVRSIGGEYTLRSRTTIAIATRDPRLIDVAELLREALAGGGVRALIRFGPPVPGGITLEAAGWFASSGGAAADSEAYDLWVRPDGVRMRAGSPTGLLWAIQTFRQLLPPDFEIGGPPQGRPLRREWRVAAVEIHDAPRFRWRGAMLDVGRHFYPVADVKRFIDLIARYKLNVFHWHLTEDQGWRIEIRKYPRLTEVGGWRTEPDGSRHGGFYTQREIRDVVAYARRRGITVVPEIEMPGHSSAAIAAYPWLGCTNDTIPVPNSWGVFADVFCIGKPEVLAFLENVLDEVVPLFPGRYFHIGGDEVPKDRWRACDSCQALMRREGLHSEDELQSWFTRRMAASLERRGKRLIGWDEITEGGLPPGVLVQVWRTMAHAESTARRGQDVIASPTSHVYLDYNPATQTMERVYSFDPIPAGLEPEFRNRILGGEAPLWSEHIDANNLDLVAFPRLLAFAEALWSPLPREFADFATRLARDQYPRLRNAGVTPGPENRDILRMRPVVDPVTGRVRVQVDRGVSDIVIRYALDGDPGAASPEYTDSVAFDSGTVVLRAFLGDRPLLYHRRLVFAAHAARGRAVTLSVAPGRNYAGTGPNPLTDGLLASLDHTDGLWQGWQRPEVEAVIDLGTPREVHEVTCSFLQITRSWIVLPRSMELLVSDDSTSWRSIGRAEHAIPADRFEPFVQRLSVPAPAGTRARWLKVAVRSFGPLPPWHSGAGRPSWIFADEIVVR